MDAKQKKQQKKQMSTKQNNVNNRSVSDGKREEEMRLKNVRYTTSVTGLMPK